MQLSQNYFELFELPVSLEVDLQELAGRYRELQKTLHPDRFAGGAEREQRLAVQYTAHLNDAYTTLRDPIRRVQYLLRLKGQDLAGESVTTRDAGFLMQQMGWREALEEARHAANPLAELERLEAEVAVETRRLLAEFSRLYFGKIESGKAEGGKVESGEAERGEAESRLPEAAECARKLQFMDKMRREIEALEEDLTDL